MQSTHPQDESDRSEPEGYEIERPAESAPREPVASPPATAATPAAETPPVFPLVRTDRFELPLLTGGIALALFIVGCLAGLGSLFPQWHAIGAEPDGWVRVNVALRGTLLVAIGAACLAAGLVTLVFLDRRPTGDARVLLVRCGMIAAISLLARTVPIPFEFLKLTWDVAGPIAVAFLLLMPSFRLPAREAATALGAALIVLVFLSMASIAVGFATGGPLPPSGSAG